MPLLPLVIMLINSQAVMIKTSDLKCPVACFMNEADYVIPLFCIVLCSILMFVESTYLDFTYKSYRENGKIIFIS